MKYGVQKVSINALMRSGWLTTEMRLKVNQEKARQYAEEMNEGHKFPVPVVFLDPATQLTHVGDGFHRIVAHSINNEKSVTVDLKRGTAMDAILHNIAENRKQRGLPFSQGDLRKCVVTLLVSEATENWTQTKVAQTVGCSGSYVSYVRNQLELERPETYKDKNGRVLPRKNKVDTDSIVNRRKAAAKMFFAGIPQTKIASQLGASRATVQRDLEIELRGATKCPTCNGTGVVHGRQGRDSA